MKRVAVRELRRNLSRYLGQVKAGESFAVTERGRDVARLVASRPSDSPIAPPRRRAGSDDAAG